MRWAGEGTVASGPSAAPVYPMGCSSSKPAKAQKPAPAFKPKITAAQLAGQHGLDFLSASKQIDLDISPRTSSEKEDPQSSWEVRDVPQGFPKGKLLPPDRKMHDKHIKKLDKFLKGIEESPSNLAEDVGRKRSKSNGGKDDTSAASEGTVEVAIWRPILKQIGVLKWRSPDEAICTEWCHQRWKFYWLGLALNLFRFF